MDKNVINDMGEGVPLYVDNSSFVVDGVVDEGVDKSVRNFVDGTMDTLVGGSDVYGVSTVSASVDVGLHGVDNSVNNVSVLVVDKPVEVWGEGHPVGRFMSRGGFIILMVEVLLGFMLVGYVLMFGWGGE